MGMIQYWGCNFSPMNYHQCDGTILSISSNTALFALLGTTYGGNGQQTFGLPDLRGRTIVGFSNTAPMGTMAGTETGVLSANNMAAHTHYGNVQIGASIAGGQSSPGGNVPGINGKSGNIYGTPLTTGSNLGGTPTVTVGNAGGTPAPFSILSPYLALTCTIATQGIFPARN